METVKGDKVMKALIQKRVTKMFDEILRYAEGVCVSEYMYSVLRRRILDVGNQTIRDLHGDCEKFKIILKAIEEDEVDLEVE